MGTARDVKELCRAALNDRAGEVAVFKVFMDESGTHSTAPVVVVSAYMARPRTWEAFTRKWNVAKRPIKVFHSVDCNAFKNEFEGWEKERRDSLVIGLLGVLRQQDMMGFVTGLDLQAFEAAMQANPELREMLPNPYATCFHWTAATVMDLIEKKSNERVAFFHETNDFIAEAKQDFEWIKANRKRHTGPVSLTFGGKDDFVPLQAADILAYEGYRRLGALEKKKRPSLDALGKHISIRWYGPENMPSLVSRLKLSHQQIKAFGRVLG